MKHTYKLIIAYDGTDFHGWQEQIGQETIISALQRAFFTVFKKTVNIVGASRTDAGVHALGQVARIKTDLDLDPIVMMTAWNYRLPSGIRIRHAERVESTFNPRTNVLQKTYHYTLFSEHPDPFIARFGWLYNWFSSVDLPTLEKVLQLYKGTHDFTSFFKRQDDDVSPIRSVDEIYLEKIPETTMYRIVVKGESFLQYQIRRMVGYALDASRHPKTAIETIQKMLDNPHHEQTLMKAGASGLCLREIIYKS